MSEIKFVDSSESEDSARSSGINYSTSEKDASEKLPEDFEPYVKEWFNSQFENLSPPQRYSFDLIHEGENSLISAPTGSGKCVKPDTTLLLEKDGSVVLKEAREVWKDRKEKVADIELDGELHRTGYSSFSLNEDKKIENRKSKVFRESYEGKMYGFKTLYGREVEVTPEHPLLVETEEGVKWKKAEKVEEGDRIGSPKKINLPEKSIELRVESALDRLAEEFDTVLTCSDVEAIKTRFFQAQSLNDLSEESIKQGLATLGLSYSDLGEKVSLGTTTVHNLINGKTEYRAEQVFREIRNRLKEIEMSENGVIVKQGDGSVTRFTYPEKVDSDVARMAAFVTAEGLIGDYEENYYLMISQKNRDKLLKDTLEAFREKFSVDFQKKNHKDYVLNDSAFSLFFSQLLGIKPGTGRDVRFPNWVMNTKEEFQREFISTFISLEAEVRKNEIRLHQANKRKIEQLNYILLSMNIYPALSETEKSATNTEEQKKRTYHGLTIRGIPNLLQCREKLEITHPKMDKLRKHTEGKRSGNYLDKHRFDYKEIRKLSEYFENNEEFDRELGNIYEVVRRTGHITDQALSKLKKKLEKLPENDHIKSLREKIEEIQDRNITWLEVKEKEAREYSGDIIDLSVPDLRNYVGGKGGLYLHNTLSAFLSALNELYAMGESGELDDEIYVLYVSPLRALNNDIQRNLKAPLEGISEKAEEMGYEIPEVRSAVRTGDTTDAEKTKMREKPPHILITTPESLGIILNSPKFGQSLKNVKYVITDEIHSLSENKRGTHLSLSLERLEEMANTSPTRIGLSATQAPIDEIAKYLVGYENKADPQEEITERGDEVKFSEQQEREDYETRGCTIVDVASSKEIDIETVAPVDDLIHTDPGIINEAMYDQMHEMVQAHDSSIIFTNTRSATERVVNNLKERFPDHYDENIGAHHSSMSREKRLKVEEKLKKGEMKVGVTSTSLELGVDIGTVELVLQLGSPKGVARGIQRIGRSGHKIGEKAKGKMVVVDRDDAMECSVLTKCAKEDDLDRIQIPRNALDVLAQHVVGMACNHKWSLEHAFNVIRKSYSYVNLERDDFDAVIKYLGGEYELEDQNVYRKIWIDRDEGLFGRSGKMTQVIYMTNIGTIPDESGYDVVTRGSKDYVGQLDEEFLDRLTKGDIFTLGGSTYQFSYAKGMKVFVDPKPQKSPTVPSWYSERLPLSYDLGVKIGKFRKDVAQQIEMGATDDDIIEWMMHEYYLNENTANAIYSYINEQKQFLGKVSTHEDITVERYIDDDQRQNLIFHTIYGRRTHDAMARILAHMLQKKMDSNIGMVIDDNGFILVTPRRPIDVEKLMGELAACDLEEELKEAVAKTELMKRRFRHVGGRSLMILRNYGGNSKTVGQQQMKGHFLLAATRNEYGEDFPMIKETYREIMEDAMDIRHTKEVVEKIGEGDIGFEVFDSKIPSPFSHNLLLQGSTDVVKMEDKKERLQQLHQQVLDSIED